MVKNVNVRVLASGNSQFEEALAGNLIAQARGPRRKAPGMWAALCPSALWRSLRELIRNLISQRRGGWRLALEPCVFLCASVLPVSL